MKTTQIVLDSLDRVHELVPVIINRMSLEDLLWQADEEANSVGWLLWHLLRVEDDIISDLSGEEPLWTVAGWATRFALPYAEDEVGFGMPATEVRRFRLRGPEDLLGYAKAVAARSTQTIRGLTDSDLDTVIDTNYVPPVTKGVRLVSLIVELSQHIGQAGYVKGLRERDMGRTTGWKGYV